jgi:hypothetical protein
MHEPTMTTDERGALERSVTALSEAAQRVVDAGSSN